jgi:hypothetical protein
MVQQFWQRGKKRDLAQVVPYGKSKVQDLIKRQVWIEGLHYVTDGAGDRLYNLTLIADWVANMGDSAAHQKACELYLSSLPSNWVKPRGMRQIAA